MKNRIKRCAILIIFITVLLFSANRSETAGEVSFASHMVSAGKTITASLSLMDVCMDASIKKTEQRQQPTAAVPNAECFTYEELPDGTLRITGYYGDKNTQNPYHVIIPSHLDGKPVSTLGEGCLSPEDSHDWNLTELTISEGITTLESYLYNLNANLYLVKVPDTVTSIDQKAFYRVLPGDGDKIYDEILDIAIACNDTSYTYHYALANDFACQIITPTLPENQFLLQYTSSPTCHYPYYCHYRMEGSMYDYVVVEYLNLQMELRMQVKHYTSWNEFIILTLDKASGAICQCIDSSMMEPDKIDLSYLPGVTYRNLLSLADWNFDGIEDLHCYQGYYGTGATSFSSLFIYDADSECYVNQPHFLGIDSAQLREDKQCIYSYSRGNASTHYVQRYEYIDGELSRVARLTETVLESDAVEITDERKINGKWQVYRQETFYPHDTSQEESYQDALEQASVLYVNDGYWDL